MLLSQASQSSKHQKSLIFVCNLVRLSLGPAHVSEFGSGLDPNPVEPTLNKFESHFWPVDTNLIFGTYRFPIPNLDERKGRIAARLLLIAGRNIRHVVGHNPHRSKFEIILDSDRSFRRVNPRLPKLEARGGKKQRERKLLLFCSSLSISSVYTKKAN